MNKRKRTVWLGILWKIVFFNLSLISNTSSYLFDAQAERFIYSFLNTAREMDFSDILEILTQSEPFVRDVFTAAMQQDRIPSCRYILKTQ